MLVRGVLVLWMLIKYVDWWLGEPSTVQVVKEGPVLCMLEIYLQQATTVSYIFGKLSPCSFTWSYPGRIFLHKIFEEKRKKQKMHFFAIFRVAPP